MADDNGDRSQPEFSPGERIAHVEALLDSQNGIQAQLDRRLNDMGALTDEKLKGLRAEHEAALEAQEKAVEKVETVTDRRFESVAVNAEKREGLLSQRIDGIDTRVQTLERGESVGLGAKTGFSSAWGVVVTVITIGFAAATVIAVILVSHG